jgi:Zn-dependent protease with chaperone function
MKQILILSLIIPCIVLVVKYTGYFVYSLVRKDFKLFKENNYKEDFIVSVILFIMMLGFYFTLAHYLTAQDTDFVILITGLGGLIPIVFSYLLSPLKYFFKSKNHTYSTEISEQVKKWSGKKIRIYIINQDILNAYATGVIPFTKIILLGKPIFEKLSQEERDAIIAHEMGHIQKNHLFKLFLIHSIWAYLVIISFNFLIFPYAQQTNYTGLIVSVYYGLLGGGGTVIVSGWFQKKFELEADSYASTLVKVEFVKDMLHKLNEESNGLMTKWSFNYPTLKERINNLNTNPEYHTPNAEA